jgi:hypothetical protein
MTTYLEALEQLLQLVEKYQGSSQKYDEWQDTDACSLLTEMDSPTFAPLFEEYAKIQASIGNKAPERIDRNSSISLGSPHRDIVTDEYGQQYVSYYYSRDHLSELKEAIETSLDYLKP